MSEKRDRIMETFNLAQQACRNIDQMTEKFQRTESALYELFQARDALQKAMYALQRASGRCLD